MGLFGGNDDNGGNDRSNQLLDEQLTQNKAELEQKRQSLVDQRMAIVKSQGGEVWAPDRNAAYTGKDAATPKMKPDGGWFKGFAR